MSTGSRGNTLEVDNISAFARLYGYIRYFHPSDEASQIDWNLFAILGVQHVKRCRTGRELKDSLTALFLPIAPAMQIIQEGESVPKEPYPIPYKKGYKIIAWQYLGVNLGFKSSSFNSDEYVYKNNRTNRSSDSLLFHKTPGMGEFLNKGIGCGLRVISPLALYGSTANTFPQADYKQLAGLKEQIRQTAKEVSPDSLCTILGDIVIAWNVFQHFHPYRKFLDHSWNEVLGETLQEALLTDKPYLFKIVLQHFAAKINDGHTYVSGSGSGHFYAPISWDWIDHQLVITDVRDSRLDLSAGDIVKKINLQSPDLFFDSVAALVSASTPQFKAFRCRVESLGGDWATTLQLEILDQKQKSRSVDVLRLEDAAKNTYSSLYQHQTDTITVLPDSILYINLRYASMKDMQEKFSLILHSKVVIFDIRGYPNDNDEIIRYLLTQNDTSREWMQIPEIIYPDQERVAGFLKQGWSLKAKSPHIGAKIIFITDASCMSYTESFVSFIKHYRLGVIIGQATAGTNGNVNYLPLPGGMLLSWTGMMVHLHDGSLLFGKGILPDIPCEHTYSGISRLRDEFLDKAIEVAYKWCHGN